METDSIDFFPWLEASHKLPGHQIAQKQVAARLDWKSLEIFKPLLATQALHEASSLERNKLGAKIY